MSPPLEDLGPEIKEVQDAGRAQVPDKAESSMGPQLLPHPLCPKHLVRLDPEDTCLVSWAEMTSPELKKCWEGPKFFFTEN